MKEMIYHLICKNSMSRSKLQFIIGHGFIFIFLGDKLFFLLLYFFELFFLISTTDQLVEHLWIIIINIFVHPCLQSLHQFFLNAALDICSDQCFCLSNAVSSLCLLFYWNELLFALQLQLSDLDEHLPQLGQALLAFVDLERRPIY